ncbi:M35 family metallo-endopeptidase [Caballeronia novacaledonica]|uniref:M35 family metallo-endopeptidase n=1 Tax=Caballeronia novacaledonica TaxID=1544861 RepID=UPI0015E7E168
MNSKLKTIVHECTHYVDTFNSDDIIYGSGYGLAIWAGRYPNETAKNADSITCYITEND